MKRQPSETSHPIDQKSLDGDPGRDQGSGPDQPRASQDPSVEPDRRVPQVSVLRPGNSSRLHRLIGPAVILFAAFVAVAPQLVRGASCGHDFDFHLVSWFDCLNSWRHGLLYPHWTPSANFGAGEPRFVFYPPLTWMLGAALALVLPWTLVGLALTFLLLAATGLATRALARQALSDGPATLAGCAALFSGYALFTAYERTAFGELAGGFWIPLLLLFILRDRNPPAPAWRRALDGSTAPLAVVLAGAWLSNAPLGVMASYLLAATALAAAGLLRSWAPVLRAAAAAALGLGLGAVYLVPAAVEQHWVEIGRSMDEPGSMVENSWLFARQSSPDLKAHDEVLYTVSIVAVIMIALAVIGLIVSWRRGSLRGKLHWWLPLAAVPFAVLFLQLPVSLPVWNLLPRLRFLQFPWRWLVVLEAPMAIFLAAAVWPRESARWRWRVGVAAVCAMGFLGASAYAGIAYFQACDEQDNVPAMVDAYRDGGGFEGSDEYAPLDSDNALIPNSLPEACLVSDPATVLGKMNEDTGLAWEPAQGSCEATIAASPQAAKARPEHLRIVAAAAHDSFLILRLCSYPAWSVKVNGQPVADLPQRDDGLMAVPVARGPVDLTVDWTTTPDVILSRWLSSLSVLLLTGLCLLERRLSLARL